MRWTQTLIPTQKETPADAVIVSHQLMIRAGLIRQLAAGAYDFLPLGFRSLRKAAQIVREEMDRIGAAETLLPALQPVELWQRSGRDVERDDETELAQLLTERKEMPRLRLGFDQDDGSAHWI